MKNKKSFDLIMFSILYWVLQLTWGSLMTIAGLIGAAGVLLFNRRAHVYRNGCSFIVEFGGNWGGLNLGAVSFCGKYYWTDHQFYNETRFHEFGHSIQNAWFGPFFIFVIGIPSLVRYLICKHKNDYHGYYDIWFEKHASKIGCIAEELE